jgi:hypothetical protein
VLTEVEKHMTATPELLKALVEAELNLLSDGRVLTHIRSLLVPAKPVLRLWDYGSDGEQFRCWTVLEHPASNTGIAYCENGFGPRSPWGLVHLEGSKDQTSIGMDAGWFTTFLQVYFESQAVSELPIWRVEKTHCAAAISLPVKEVGTKRGLKSCRYGNRIRPIATVLLTAFSTNGNDRGRRFPPHRLSTAANPPQATWEVARAQASAGI